ncbi:hypothetical protein Pelo_17219 [Pelomyxa schiedti]|nr:hypothetical protein Pelo_17219 [Pelomyxa schiedti]
MGSNVTKSTPSFSTSCIGTTGPQQQQQQIQQIVPPQFRVDVIISAADQFIAFACGSVVARTRQMSPSRTLAASPTLVEQFGREWVVCGCRDVVFTIRAGGSTEHAARDRNSDHQLQVWMSLSPTLGVVRSVHFVTLDARPVQLVGCIAGSSRETARRIQQEWPSGSGVVEDTSRLLMTTGFMGTLVDIVDGRGSGVRNLAPGDGSRDPRWVNTYVFCNSRWVVLLNSAEMTLWRLWLCRGDDEKLFTEECRAKISLSSSFLDVSFSEVDPNVLLVAVPKPDGAEEREIFLWHVELNESFKQKSIVLKTEAVLVPFPPKWPIIVLGGSPICVVMRGSNTRIHYIHNTITNETHTIEGSVLPVLGNLLSVGPTTTCTPTTEFSIPFQRRVPVVPPHTTTDDYGSVTMKATTLQRCGIFVWEFCGSPPSTQILAKHAITDAQTDTLLAFITCHKP